MYSTFSNLASYKKNIICVYCLLQTLFLFFIIIVTRERSDKITKCIIDGAVVALLKRGFVYLCLEANHTAPCDGVWAAACTSSISFNPVSLLETAVSVFFRFVYLLLTDVRLSNYS